MQTDLQRVEWLRKHGWRVEGEAVIDGQPVRWIECGVSTAWLRIVDGVILWHGAEDQIESVQPAVIDSTAVRLPDNEIAPQALYDGTRGELVAYMAGIKDESARMAYSLVLDLIAEATDAAALRARKDTDIVPTLRQLQVSKRIGEATVKLMEQRCAVLEAL